LRKINGISLALVVTPLLFIGCTSEKVSTIIPVKSTDKKIVLDLGEKSQSHIIKENNSTEEKRLPLAKTYPIENSQENELLSQLIEASGNEFSDETMELSHLTTASLSMGNDWKAWTKEDEIIETAKQFLGVKYIWAANGPSAFDCSGFTKYVFRKNGITLPRYSGYQAKVGEKIRFSELQKGDLVFFDTTKKFSHRVNHVGIYIGHHKFIHASSGGKKVMITSFDKKKFYKHKFLYAKRIIGQSQNLAFNQSKRTTLTN